MTSNGIPITSLLDIGSNLAGNTVFPVVDVASNTSNKANMTEVTSYVLTNNFNANLGNINLSGNLLFTNNAHIDSSTSPATLKVVGPSGVGVSITANATKTWSFDVFGNVTFPDSTVQPTAWTGNVPVANVTGIGNIATRNLDGNASNVLKGDGGWTALPIITGNVANANFDGNAANVLIGNGIFRSIIGDGGNLTNIAGANVVGAVSFASTANSVAVANVTGIGNIATINKDGNASNVLWGNGVFANNPIPVVGNIAATNFDGVGGHALLGNGVFGFVTAGNVTGLGNIAPVNLDGNASNVLSGAGTFVTPVPGNNIFNGGSSVSIPLGNGNVILSSNSNTIATITGTGANVTGYISVTGNIQANVVQSNITVKLAVYADNTARDAAIPSPSAGMIIFNTTGAKFQGYDGSAWANLN